MAYVPFDLGTGSNQAEDGHAGACRHVNCHVEELGEDAKGIKAIVSSDGFVDFATLANSGAVRATFAVTANLLLVVAGRLLFSVDQTGSTTVVGGIPSDGHVSMARNREAPDPTVAIVCDGLVWYYKAGVLTQNTDPDLPPPVSVTGVDGYFSFQAADGRNFASGLDDPDVTALSFASAEAKADPGVVNWTRGRDLMLGGTETIEAWDNQGNDPYPFVRTTIVTRAEDGKFIGVLAPGAVSEGFFVGSDKTVRMLQGYQARRISTHAVERAIADDPAPSGIKVATWDSRGHTHYALSGTAWTWVYNSTTGKWYERESYGLTRWKISTAVQFGDKVILGDATQGKLYQLSHGTYTEAGGHLISTIQAPPVHGFPYRFKHTALYLDVVPAVGTIATPNPMLMLDWSDDGGKNWSAQRMIDLGGPSQALKRVKVTRLGVAQSRTYRFSMSAATRRCFVSAGVDVERLRA